MNCTSCSLGRIRHLIQPILATHPRILWNLCPFTHALSQNNPHKRQAVTVKVMVKSFDTEMLQSSSDQSTYVCGTQPEFQNIQIIFVVFYLALRKCVFSILQRLQNRIGVRLVNLRWKETHQKQYFKAVQQSLQSESQPPDERNSVPPANHHITSFRDVSNYQDITTVVSL